VGIGAGVGAVAEFAADGVDGDGAGFAFDAHAVEFLPDEGGGLGLGGFAGDDVAAVVARESFQAGTEVDGVADDGVAAAQAGAHVAHAHGAGVDADAHADGGQALAGVLAVDVGDGLHHVERSLHGEAGVVGCVNGCAPEGHDAVAHVFVDGASVAADDGG
jgi:hypothetical protein